MLFPIFYDSKTLLFYESKIFLMILRELFKGTFKENNCKVKKSYVILRNILHYTYKEKAYITRIIRNIGNNHLAEREGFEP